MELNELGKIIYVRRVNKTDLCDKLGITRSTLYRNMEGKIKMPFYQVEQVADILQVDINSFREPNQ